MWAEQGLTTTGEPVSLQQAGGFVTLVEGSSFVLSERSGDIRPGGAAGLFVLDSRVVSRWEIIVDGRSLDPLSVSVTEPFAATFVSRLPPLVDDAGATLLVVRKRWVGSGMREDIEVRNYSNEVESHVIELHVASDLADLFAVKAGHLTESLEPHHSGGDLLTSAVRSGVRREVRVAQRSGEPPAEFAAGGLRWLVTIPARGVWQVCLEVTLSVDGDLVALRYRCGEPPTESLPARRLAGWRSHTPTLTSCDERLSLSIAQGADDVGSLIIEDPVHPESPVVAAGAPWFMALFGRDSLLTSYMAMIVDPALAVGVLQTLGRLQGRRTDRATEEQPGRILHEVRFSSATAVDLDKGQAYYGSIDATPLFVVLVGELSRWGVESSVIDDLLPHVDAALEWIEKFGDSDGDGYVEYERLSTDGLANQGWKDSWDSISSASGALAEGPIALAEVQGYVYQAYLARAELADVRQDDVTASRWRLKAADLRAAFNQDFWLPERGWYAVALDGEKHPVDALASNMGHCLWSGIIDPEHAAAVAAHLLSPDMFSGWGLRTLATTMVRYNPLSYHNGSVWPHDSVIAAAGLMRYGFVDESVEIIDAVLDAATATGGRLPELYAGLDRAELPVPVAYPTSCSPQAWAAAAPLLMLRTLMRFDPRLDLDRVTLSPVAGTPKLKALGSIEFDFGGSRLRLGRSPDGELTVSGLPAGVAHEHEPRP